MDVLVAEDHPPSRRLLSHLLQLWGHGVTAVGDGDAALSILESRDAPRLAILDWRMPGVAGIEICRRLRQAAPGRSSYLILLTGADRKEDVVQGLGAGADDYVIKPFDHDELRARVGVGVRVVALHHQLETQLQELEASRSSIDRLHRLLPICAWCKRVRAGDAYWQEVEDYISGTIEQPITHGICPECTTRFIEGAHDSLSDPSS